MLPIELSVEKCRAEHLGVLSLCFRAVCGTLRRWCHPLLCRYSAVVGCCWEMPVDGVKVQLVCAVCRHQELESAVEARAECGDTRATLRARPDIAPWWGCSAGTALTISDRNLRCQPSRLHQLAASFSLANIPGCKPIWWSSGRRPTFSLVTFQWDMDST